MKYEFQVGKLCQIVNENLVAHTDERALEVYNIKNELATSMIFHVVSDEVLLIILSSISSKEAWDRLNKIYLGSKFSIRFTILQKFLQSHQGEDENISIYLNKIIELRNQIVAYGCNGINDEFMVFIILQSLYSKFSNFLTIIETKLGDEEEVFSLDNLSRLLLKHKS